MLHNIKKYVLGTLICLQYSCGSDSEQTPIDSEPNIDPPIDTHCPGTVSDAEPTGNYDVLVWADEFDTQGFPCRQNWDAEIGKGQNGWGNWEKQYYTRSNAHAENGILSITAKEEDYRGSQYP